LLISAISPEPFFLGRHFSKSFSDEKRNKAEHQGPHVHELIGTSPSVTGQIRLDAATTALDTARRSTELYRLVAINFLSEE
jgi:hypothetical protein